MTTFRTIDTGQINLYGKMSQSGQYLCINSPGDYYDIQAATIIFDCQAAIDSKPDSQCYHTLEYAATYNTVDLDGNFYVIGSRYSYYTGEYEFNYAKINPSELFENDGYLGVEEDFPGTVLTDIKQMMMPYGLYINPYTGYIYATDAASFTAAGKLYQWSPDGKLLGTFKVYINPAHFLALPPDGKFESGALSFMTVDTPTHDNFIYNLQGIKVKNLRHNGVYVQNGRKFIYK